MKCPNCGAELITDASICRCCGMICPGLGMEKTYTESE
jgi:predicted RNA-binding Zn-ribbon protein involved in translation (DUF1610 family)